LRGRRRIKVVKGGIWTTDAIFRETFDKVIKYSSKEVYGVDKESTALMTVADYRNVRLGVIAAVSDELHHDGRWIKGFNTRRLRQTENLVVKEALNTIIDFA
jgi:nucleoside phosphorylase